MVASVDSTGRTWLSHLARVDVRRHSCRLLATVALGLLVQTATGCTLAGYAIGNAAIATPRSIPPQNARAISRGTEVEVFYLPWRDQASPPTAAGSLAAPLP